MDWLPFTLRWFHLVAAITAVGGTIFMRFALVPSVGVLGDDQRKALHEQVRSRWAKIVAACIAFLLISGLWNYILLIQASRDWGPEWKQAYGKLYHAVFGIKFLLALAIFFIASALSGRGNATQRFRQNARLWMSVNVALALVVVALSGVLRMTHAGPTLPPAPTVPAVEVANG